MAYSVKWLTSGEAATARYKRLAGDDEIDDFNSMARYQYVVHVELNGNCENLERFQEVDADSINHAFDLAKQWVIMHNATSVGIRKVERDGSLGSPDVYDWSDFMEEAIDVVKQWRKKQ